MEAYTYFMPLYTQHALVPEFESKSNPLYYILRTGESALWNSKLHFVFTSFCRYVPVTLSRLLNGLRENRLVHGISISWTSKIKTLLQFFKCRFYLSSRLSDCFSLTYTTGNLNKSVRYKIILRRKIRLLWVFLARTLTYSCINKEYPEFRFHHWPS